MIATLLNKESGLKTLDYILLTVKAPTNRVDQQVKYIYDRIDNLYAEDIKERLVGMFTFSDNDKPLAQEALKACDIVIKDENMFTFNNAKIWNNPSSGGNNEMVA